MIPNNAICHGEVRTFLGHCDRKPTIERDGKPYCWQHDPERLRRIARQRSKQRRIAHDTHEAELKAKWDRDDLQRTTGIHDLTTNDLKRIVKAGGIFVFLPWHQKD